MTAQKRIRRLTVTVPPTPPIAATPGDSITTLSGTAIVTRLEQVGDETIAWADYGSGIEQPHTGEAVSPHPKGTIFYRSGKAYTLVAASAEEAVLNWDDGAQCVSTRLNWAQVQQKFTLTLPIPTDEIETTAGNPARKSNTRRRRQPARTYDDGAGKTNQGRSRNGAKDVLSPQRQEAAEAERQPKVVSLESPLEQGDLIRAKDHLSEAWHEGHITRLGRTYARLDNDRATVILEGAELLKRNPLPYHLLNIVGLSWEEQADKLLDHLHFGNLACFYVAGESTPLEQYRGWTIGTAPNGSRQDFEISKGNSAWFLRDRQHDRLKAADRRIAWCKHAVDHVERQLARLEQLTTAPTRIDSQAYPLEQCSIPSDSLKASADLPVQLNCSEDSATGNSLKSTPTVSRFSVKTSPESPSGQTFGTITLIPESSTSSLADSPARIFPQPTIEERDSQENDRDSGLKCLESFGKLGPDLSLLKTSPQLKTGIGLTPSWRDWLKAGSMLNGRLFQQQEWERPTCEKGSSLLPTPTAGDFKDRVRSKSAQGGATLPEVLKLKFLPAPLSSDRGSVREDFRPTLNIVLKQPNQVCNPEIWEWMMGFPPGWTELPTVAGGRKMHPPEAQACPPGLFPTEAIASKPAATPSPLSKPASLFAESYNLQECSERAESTHDAIAMLEQERDRIKAEGAIASDGCWIETGKVKGRNFRQAWWRASKPLFTPKRSRGNVEAKVKSQYIGEEGSPEHKEAIAQRDRRDALKRIEKQIQILMEECNR